MDTKDGGANLRYRHVARELVKEKIKPMGAPCDTHNLTTYIQLPADVELIARRLEETEEKRAPEGARAKVRKYTLFALVGLGRLTFRSVEVFMV